MKKRYSVFGGLLLSSFVLVGTSWATPCPCVDGKVQTTWVDDIVLDSPVKLYQLSKIILTPGITDDGFNVRGDMETDGNAELFFSHTDSYDQALVTRGAWWKKGLNHGSDGDREFEAKWSGINDLNTYGALGGTIIALPGWYDDFKFNTSIVSADDQESILEPATLLLFGTGIAGLAGWSRRARKKTLGDDGGLASSFTVRHQGEKELVPAAWWLGK